MNTQKNPYIGPRTFQRNEGHLFFGREREARDLIALVASERLVIFYAQSGAGKSSIVNTRLIPNLESKEYEVLPVGRVSGDASEAMEADNIYIYNLIRSLEQHDVDPAVLSRLTLAEFLCQLNYDEKGFFYDASLAAEAPVEDEADIIRRALVIDQFEELFSTHPEAWERRENFFKQVAQAMQDDPHLWVVLVMREDYIAALDPYAHLLPNGLRVRYYMQRLEREAALKAVKSPVAEVRPYADGVAEKLIDDLCSIKVQKPDGDLDIQPGQYVEPVQMQVVCYGLWENLSLEGTQITEKDLQEVGDVNQSLGKYYDRRVGEVARAKSVNERLIREWFEKKLITTGGIRNMVLQERETKSGELADDVIQALQSDLVRAEKRGGATWYELTHDRLVEPILERNKIWFSENLSPLQRQAALWKDQDQNESWLLRDDALIEVEAWAKDHQTELTETEVEFLAACRKLQAQIDERHAAERHRLEMAQKIAEEQARSARRARIFNVVSGVLIVVALIATGYAFYKASEANKAQAEALHQSDIAHSGELAALALERSGNELDLAILLGVQAYAFDNNSQSQKSLLTLLQKSDRYHGSITSEADVQEFQYSPTGDYFVTRDEKGITFWTTEHREKLNAIPISEHYSGVTALALSKDGQRMASGAEDGTIVIWDAKTHEQLSEPFRAHGTSVSSLAFSNDGNTLVSSGSGDESLPIIWDLKDDPATPGQNDLSFDTKGITTSFIALNPADDNMLAIGFSDGTILLWNMSNGKPYSETPIKTSGRVGRLLFDTKGKLLVASSPDSATLTLIDVRVPAKPQKYSDVLNEAGNVINSIAISPDDKTLAAGDSAGLLTLWNITDPKKPQSKKDILRVTNNSGISSLVFTADGRNIVTSTYGGNIMLWDAVSFKRLSEPARGGPRAISALLLTPDHGTLIGSSYDSTISFWDVRNLKEPRKTGEPLQGHPGQPYSMMFSSDGSLLMSSGYDATILVDVSKQQPLGVGDFRLSPDESVLAYQVLDRTTDENTIHLRDIKTGVDGDPIPGKFPNPSSIFSPDNKKLIFQTSNEAGKPQFHIWDIENNRELPGPPTGDYVGFSPNSQLVIYQTTTETKDAETGTTSQTYINVWDISAGKALGTDIEGSYVTISPDSKILIYLAPETDGHKQSINLWDLTNASIRSSIEGYSPFPNTDGSILAYSTTDAETQSSVLNLLNTSTGESIIEPIPGGNFLTLSRDGKVLFYYTPEGIGVVNVQMQAPVGETVRGSFWGAIESGPMLAYAFYDFINGKVWIEMINTTTMNQTGDPIEFNPNYGWNLIQDGAVLIYSTPDGQTNFMNTATGAKSSLKGTSASYLTSTPDNRFLIYQTTEDNSYEIRLWDSSASKDFGEPIKGTFRAISPDGNVLVTSNENKAIFWDVTKTASLGELVPEQSDSTWSAALSSTGNTLAIADSRGVTLLDMSGKNQSITTPNVHNGTFYNFLLSPDKKTMLTTGEDNKTVVWDLNAFETIGDPIPGTNSAFSPDSKLVAVGNTNENMITLWNIASQEVVGETLEGSGFVFSPNGKTLAVTDPKINATVLWSIQPPKQISDPIPGQSVTFNPDGSLVAINDGQNTLLYDLNKRQNIGDPLPGYVITSLTTEGFATVNVSGNTTTFWDWATKQPIVELPGFDSYFSGTKIDLLIVRDSIGNTTTFWNPATRSQVGTTMTGMYYPSFSPDNMLISMADLVNDTTVIWDVQANEQVGEDIEGYYNPVLCEDTNGPKAAWFDNTDARVSIWDLVAGQPIDTIELDEQSAAYGVSLIFSPDCSLIAIGDYSRNRTIFRNIAASASNEKILNNGSYAIFSPDGSVVALVNYNQRSTTFWHLSDFTQIGREVPGSDVYFNPENNNVLTINSYYCTTNSCSNKHTVWNFNAAEQIGDEQDGYSYPTFLSESTLIRNSSKAITFLDTNTGDEIGQLTRGHTAQITGIRFSPVDENIMASMASDGIFVTRFDPLSSTHLDTGDYSGALNQMVMSTDGQHLSALGADGRIYIWDIGSDPPVLTATVDTPYKNLLNRVSRSVLSPDGQYLAYILNNSTLNIWSIEQKGDIRDPLGKCCDGPITFSPDGISMFYSNRGKVFRWDHWNNPAAATSPVEILTAGDNLTGLKVIMGDQEPRYLATEHSLLNGQTSVLTTQLWELEKNSIVGEPISGSLLDSSVAAQALIYKDNDGKLLKWYTNPTVWKYLLCQRAGRNLDLKEWIEFIGDRTVDKNVLPYQAICPQFKTDPISTAAP